MIFFFLTFPLALLYWLYLIRYRIKSFSGTYGFFTGALVLIYVFSSIILISFREIAIIDGIIYGGLDAPEYLLIYESANATYLDSLLIQFYEPGYATLVWFFSSYIGGYNIFQIFLYGFMYGTLYIFLKNFKPDGYLLISILMLSLMLVHSLNIIRVTLAIFIGFYVIYFLYKNNFLMASLIAMIALSVHLSALFLLIMIVFYYSYVRFGRLKYFIIYSIFTTFSIFISFIVLPRYMTSFRLAAYNENDGSFSLNTFIVASIILFLTFNRYNAFVKYNRYNQVLIAILPTIFLILPIFYNYPIAYRFLLYYLPVIYLLIPSILHIYKPKTYNDLVYLPLLFMLIIYIIIKLYKFFSYEINYFNYVI